MTETIFQNLYFTFYFDFLVWPISFGLEVEGVGGI